MFPGGQETEKCICWWDWGGICRFEIWGWNSEENRCRAAYLQALFHCSAYCTDFCCSLLFSETELPILMPGLEFLITWLNEILSFVLGNLHVASECTILRLIHDGVGKFYFLNKMKEKQVCLWYKFLHRTLEATLFRSTGITRKFWFLSFVHTLEILMGGL